MHLSSISSFAGILTALAVAFPEPQNPAQTTAASLALQSYQEGLATNPAFNALVANLATNPAAITSLLSWQQSILSASATLPPNYLDALPTEARSLFGSVATAVNSIRTEHGFSNGLAVKTSVSKAGAAPRQTVSISESIFQSVVGVGAGFVGLVWFGRMAW